MKTISKLFVMCVCFIMIGCVTQNVKPVVKDGKTQDHVWEPDKKNYWITLYFTKMSFDPSVRMKYPPQHLYNLCKCILDVMSNDYDYETFVRDFNKRPISPQNNQIVYDISLKCSMEEVELMKLKFQQGEVNPKNMI